MICMRTFSLTWCHLFDFFAGIRSSEIPGAPFSLGSDVVGDGPSLGPGLDSVMLGGGLGPSLGSGLDSVMLGGGLGPSLGSGLDSVMLGGGLGPSLGPGFYYRKPSDMSEKGKNGDQREIVRPAHCV